MIALRASKLTLALPPAIIYRSTSNHSILSHGAYIHRLIEINGNFFPRTGWRDHAKLIKRDIMSFIIRLIEMALFRRPPIHSFNHD